jgi:hypothetical protein
VLRKLEQLRNLRSVTPEIMRAKSEQEEMQDDLIQFVTLREFATASFYKVTFHIAFDLVAKRDVYLRHGHANVAQS